MSAPFPYEAVEGAVVDPAEGEALQLYQQYAWMAKWADRMDNETSLDLKKLAQFIAHCWAFRQRYDALKARGGGALDVVEGMFGFKKLRFKDRAEMIAALDRLYERAGEEIAWFERDMAAAKTGFALLKFDENWHMTDEPVNVEKTLELDARIAAFRAEFG